MCQIRYSEYIICVYMYKDVSSLFHATMQLGGPIWTDPIHHQEFVHNLLREVKESEKDFQTYNRMLGLLTVVSEVSLRELDLE